MLITNKEGAMCSMLWAGGKMMWFWLKLLYCMHYRNNAPSFGTLAGRGENAFGLSGPGPLGAAGSGMGPRPM